MKYKMTAKGLAETGQVHRWLILSILGLTGLVLLTYGRLVYGYFATDEWWGFSFAVARPTLKEIIQPTGLVSPGSNLLIAGLYRLFGINSIVWSSLAIGFHLISTLLIFFLMKRLGKSLALGFVVAALFAVVPMGSEFIHQFSLLPGAAGVALAFGSLLAYSYRRPWIAGLLLLLSTTFTPYVVPFAGLIFIIELFVLAEKKQWKRSFISFAPIVAVVAFYFYLVQAISFKSNQLSDRPVSGDSDMLERLRSIGQKLYQSFGEMVIYKPGQLDPKEAMYYSHIVLIVALVAIALLLIRKRYILARTAIVGILWLPIALSIFSTLNTVTIDAAYPSRYLYFSLVGPILFLGSVLMGIVAEFNGKLRWVGWGLAAVVVVVGIYYYLPKTQQTVAGEVQTGKTRRQVMARLTEKVPPPLGRHALFCFTSNTSHYGVPPEKIPMPFVHNFLFNLGLLYRTDEPKLRSLFTEGGVFLNPAASMYYFRRHHSELDGAGPGIGFATNLEECEKIYKENISFLKVSDVYGFAYDGNIPDLIQVSEPLRRYFSGDMSAKAQLYPWQQ